MNGFPNLARVVGLVARVVQELVGARLLRVGPVHLIVDVLEDGLLVLCEQLDAVRRGIEILRLARFLLGAQLADGLRDLDRVEQLAVEPLAVRRDLGVHGGLLLLGLVGLLRVRALLGDLDPIDTPLLGAEEVVVLVIWKRVGELAIAGLEVLLELAKLEDAEHLLHDVGGIDLAVARARIDLDAVEYWPMFSLSHWTTFAQSEFVPPPISIMCSDLMLFGMAPSTKFSSLPTSSTTISGSPSVLFNGQYGYSTAYFFSSLEESTLM